MSASSAPQELRLSPDKTTLTVGWAGGKNVAFSAEFLRVESPSAEVQGHGPHGAKLMSGKQAVSITGLEPVGNYAVKIVFSDGHRTGLYSWTYLETLAAEHDTRWARYLADLSAAGLSRDVTSPPVPRPVSAV